MIKLIIIVVCAFLGTAHAQELEPALEPFLKLAPDTMNPSQVKVTDLYSSPLVALALSSSGCAGEEFKSKEEYMDAVVTLAPPWDAEHPLTIEAPGAGCDLHITAAIWGDGRELGDPNVLRRIHECRAVDAMEVDETEQALMEEIRQSTWKDWDPEKSMVNLRARRAQMPDVIYSAEPDDSLLLDSRRAAIDDMIAHFERTSRGIANDRKKSMGELIRYVEQLNQALRSPTYPPSE